MDQWPVCIEEGANSIQSLQLCSAPLTRSQELHAFCQELSKVRIEVFLNLFQLALFLQHRLYKRIKKFMYG